MKNTDRNADKRSATWLSRIITAMRSMLVERKWVVAKIYDFHIVNYTQSHRKNLPCSFLVEKHQSNHFDRNLYCMSRKDLEPIPAPIEWCRTAIGAVPTFMPLLYASMQMSMS